MMGRKFEVRKQAMMKSGLHKSKLFSRYGKEIYVVARNGGTNPDSNLALKRLIERAKKEQVPLDVITRNIEKASGVGGASYTEERYEGFGPSGSAFIVDALTDNVNRTVSEVRNCFTKIGSKMGVSGSVEHMFEHLSLITVRGANEETILEDLLEAGLDVTDIEAEGDLVYITGTGYDLDTLEHTLQQREGVVIEHSESGWYPHEKIVLDDESSVLFNKFMALINDLDDVQNVYHNVRDA